MVSGSQALVALAFVAHVASSASAQIPLSPAPTPTDLAQSAPDPAPAPAPSDPSVTFGSLFTGLSDDLVRLPSKGTALTLGVGGALALAVRPADLRLTERATASVPLDRAFEVGELAGSGWVQVGGSLGTFLIAKATGSRRAQLVGADMVRAQILNAAMTQGLKFAVGRPRPDAGRFSFPSGHASSTFANATVLHRHFGWKVGVPAYGVAAYVAGSRLQENRHFASDVIFGAALGIVAGRAVTVGGGSTRFAVAPIAVPRGAGVMFTHVP